MDLIEKLAKNSFQKNLEFGYDNYNEVIRNMRFDANEISSEFDKIRFINSLLDKTNEKYNEHLKVCTNKDGCSENFDYESIAYFLQQELSYLGININNDTFTPDEKKIAEDKLDKILKEIEELKLGNQIIYDDLLKEINDLKGVYFLGKKKWYQLLAGKFVDMTVSGVVSETISKQIIETIKPNLNGLIGN